MIPEDVLREKGYIAFKNRGISMLPFLREGKDLIFIKNQKENFKKNDIVLFRRKDGQLVLHRITGKKDGKYFIMGDNCISGETVDEEQILGVFEKAVRNGKEINKDSFLYKYFLVTLPIHRMNIRIRRFIYKNITVKIRHGE